MARFLGFGNSSTALNLSTYTMISSSCSGAATTTSLSATGSFSAGQRLFIHQTTGTGAGQYEDNAVASYVAGTITTVLPLEYTYTDSGASQAQVIVVPEASSVTGTLTVPAWDGNVGGLFVVACSGTFAGEINAAGKGFRGGSGVTGARSTGKNGEGYQGTNYNAAPGSAGVTNAGTGGGGAHNNNADAGSGGGGGGHASSGTAGVTGHTTNGSGAGGPGGTVGGAELTSLFMGGGGGSGSSAYNTDSGKYSGTGGTGGGIVVVYAKAFSVLAKIWLSGARGGDVISGGGFSGGGGGGAAGSGLIKSITAVIGSSLITADGGSYGLDFQGGMRGGVGGVGRVRIEACSLSGTTSPTASTVVGGYDFCNSLAYVY